MTYDLTDNSSGKKEKKLNKTGRLDNGPMLYQCVIRSACLCLSAMALSQWRGMGVGDITGVIKVGYMGGSRVSVCEETFKKERKKKKKEVADALIAPVRLLRLCGAPRGRSV